MLTEALENGEFDELPEHRIERWGALVEGGLVEDEVRRLVDDALVRHGLAVKPGSQTYRRVALDAAKVAAAAYRVELARYDGKFAEDQIPPAWIDRRHPLATPTVRAWSGQFTQEEVDFLARPISDVAEEFIAQHLRDGRARKTERDWRMALRYFVGLVGDLRISDVTEKEVNRFHERLLNVPAEYGKGIFGNVDPAKAATKLKSFAQAVKAARGAGETMVALEGRRWALDAAAAKTAGMTKKTANKHLSFFTSLSRSRLVPAAIRPTNPFASSL
jgi:hypothetical protein